MQQIGIAITVHNRHDTAKKSIAQIRKYAPKGSKIIIVDDASDRPYKGATFRFTSNVGIAAAKNKCIELLDGCDYLFLFDDDTHPIVKGWEKPYIDSGSHHLCFTFDKFTDGRTTGRTKIGSHNGLVKFLEPCGCMLFMSRECVNRVGGMDSAYGRWGYEHVGYSTRIYNSGLTIYPFMDVDGSEKLFYSGDRDRSVERSVPISVRQSYIAANKKKYIEESKSGHYIPYKPLNHVVITTYYAKFPDPQRGVNFDADIKNCTDLVVSCNKKSKLVILTDCDHTIQNSYTEIVSDECRVNPYFQRWISIGRYLKSHPEIDQVFCTDATDVIMLKNPFMQMRNKALYVGDEPMEIKKCSWLRNNHRHHLFRRSNEFRLPLLNAGLVGGFRKEVISFCDMMEDVYNKTKGMHQLTDMAALQHICYERILQKNIIHGQQVNTVFKANEINDVSWFKHK